MTLKKQYLCISFQRKFLVSLNKTYWGGFLCIHGIGMIFALARLINPIQAALFHSVTDIFILINSVRLINFDPKT